ncbi:MAG TPA: vitamin K epoxide reductase family protein [Candidatus Saccharimonadales bacterium]|jgi:uncharacterized membrane protein|nr:vitamin K epoxide reductase family protein [Candidatus Saccharimonadales bacterium]
MFKKIKPVFELDNLRLWKLSIFGLVLSVLGISDSIYLTVAHYSQSVVLACPTTSFINCAKVTSSSYSEVFGIPAPLLGIVFFTLLFIIELPTFWSRKYLWLRNLRLAFVSIGLLSVFWFVYVELDKLHAICLYCTGVHVLTFVSFVTILFATEHHKSIHDI